MIDFYITGLSAVPDILTDIYQRMLTLHVVIDRMDTLSLVGLLGLEPRTARL